MSEQNKPAFTFPPASSSSSTSNAPGFSFGQSPASTSSNLFGSGKPSTSSATPSFGSILNQQSGNTAFGSGSTGGQTGTATGTGMLGGGGGGGGSGDKPQSSLFGMSASNPSNGAGNSNLFGNALGASSNKTTSPLSGGGAVVGNTGGVLTFGGLGGASAGGGNSGSPFSLSKPAGSGSGLSLFGQAPSQVSQPQGTSGAFAAASSSTAPAQKSLFSTGGFSTGNAGTGTSSPLSIAGLTTPAPAKPAFQFPTGSTTPAGPPPAKSDSATSDAPSAQKFGSGLFNAAAGQGSASQPAQNGPQSAASTGGLFANLGKTQGDAASTPQPQTNATAKTSLTFSNTQGDSKNTMNGSTPGFKEPEPAKTKSPMTFPQNSGESTSAKPSFGSSLFPALGSSKAGTSQPSTSSTTAATAPSGMARTSATSGPSLFANSKPTTTASGSTAPTLTSGPAKMGSTAEMSSAPGASAFGTGSTSVATGTGPGIGLGSGSGAAPLASSMSGPAPPPQSRLKNKSMDDIITRWATDLAKYQKEFQQQSEKIATWDRLLVDNSDKISKLYIRAFQAQRDAAEVERQLTTVENQQDELSSWLDKYEKEVDEIMSRQVGQGDGMNGPDQERERTYKTAERVSDRLTEMSQDLTSMIEEINNVSAMLSKTNKPDNPLSQIVRVLNGHLSLLQQIDEGAASLQSKVAAAQKESQRLGTNGYHGIGTDSADDFYRSFVGRRR